MPHIALPADLPGITGPLAAYPETGKHLRSFAEALLRGPSPLSPGEREALAAYVSAGNECVYCRESHAAAARCLLGDQGDLVDSMLSSPIPTTDDARLRALLWIADKVRQDGRLVTAEDVAAARLAGADDQAIHDAVLIAAAFCMFNRYVDGLATLTPREPAAYAAMGERMAQEGYQRPNGGLPEDSPK